jgi:hypothetical protein
MEDFYILMNKIFNNKTNICFNKITNWGTYIDSEFEKKQIWSNNHPEFNSFLIELQKINNKYNCSHNMHDIVNGYIVKKTNKLL